MARSLYIHVPFCLAKCPYCDFSSVVHDEALASVYLRALVREIELMEAAGPLDTVYIGGGTPSVLGAGGIETIMGAVRARFGLSPGAEVTVEANPGALEAGFFSALAGMGVTRASMGAQSFEDRELATLGRIHTADEAREAVGAAMGAGLDVSLDLIYGIPGQTAETWRRTLDTACALGVGHVSAYELTPEEGTPLARALGEGALVLPGEDEVVGMFEDAGAVLGARGLARYEISNYARPGRECRHNLNYWRRGEYLGAGPAAHWFARGVRGANVADVHEYVRLLGEGREPVAESHAVTADEARREAVFLGLRMTEGLDIGRLAREYGLALAPASEGLVRDGTLEVAGGRLRLTPRGTLLATPVTVRLLEHISGR